MYEIVNEKIDLKKSRGKEFLFYFPALGSLVKGTLLGSTKYLLRFQVLSGKKLSAKKENVTMFPAEHYEEILELINTAKASDLRLSEILDGYKLSF